MKKLLFVLLLVAMCVSACVFVGCDFIKGLFEKDTPKQYAYNADHHWVISGASKDDLDENGKPFLYSHDLRNNLDRTGTKCVCGWQSEYKYIDFQLNDDGDGYEINGCVEHVNPHDKRFYDIPSTYNGLPITGLYLGYTNFVLSRYTIPSTVEKFGGFEGSEFLPREEGGTVEIVIPSTIEEITRRAFAETKGLTKVTIEDGVKTIGEDAFYGCEDLVSLEMPNSVTEVEYGVFRDCKSLKNIKLSDGLTRLSANMFAGCNSLDNVSISNNVTEIGMGAFFYCTSLSNISLPANLKVITDSLFSNCKSLKQLSLPDGLEEIKPYAFKESGLTSIEIADTVTTVSKGLFVDCKDLVSAKLPNGMTKIPEELFNGCTSLSDVKMPVSYTEIGSKAFTICRSIERFDICSDVEVIGDYAFYGTGFTEVIVPYGVKTVGIGAFRKCASLKKAIIPDSVEGELRMTFKDCVALEEVKLSPNISIFGQEVFDGCTSLKNVIIPESKFSTLSMFSFVDCKSLEWVVIPTNVKLIEQTAFCLYVPYTSTPYVKSERLKHVFYAGDASAWSKVTRGGNFDSYYGDIVCFYSEVKPSAQGNYWHYVDGIPTVW